MKAKLTAIIAAVVMVLLLSSCDTHVPFFRPEPTPEPTPEAPASTNTPGPTETSEPAIIVTPTSEPGTSTFADGEIEELYALDGEYTDEYDFTWDYSYHLPLLTAKTKGAKLINEDIRSSFEPLIESALEGMEENWTLSVVNVDWEYALNGSILSLLISADYDWSFTDYVVYHYDVDSGEKLSTADVVYDLGIGEEEFYARARYTAEKLFDESNYYFLTEFCGEYGYEMSYVSTRNDTLSDAAIMNDTQVFPDDELRVILKIGSMAGAGWYYHDVPLESVPRSGFLSCSDGFIYAEYSGGETAIWFEPDGTHDWLIDRYGIDLTHAYAVHGLWSEYKDMFIAPVGVDYSPFLFMTTVRGEVECVDICRGLDGGGLFAMQLQGIGDIVSMEPDQREGYMTSSVIAYDSKGNPYDMFVYIDDAVKANDYVLVGEWSVNYCADDPYGIETEYFRYFDVTEENEFTLTVLNVDTSETVSNSGRLSYLGNTEFGTAYWYEFYGLGESGVVIIKNDIDSIAVTTLKDDLFFGVNGAATSVYTATYG